MREARKSTEMGNQDQQRPSLMQVFLDQRQRLIRIIAGMGLGTADADDILQEVSLEALRQGQEFHTESDTARWITKTTINRCLLIYRNRERFVRKTTDLARSGQIVEIQPNGAVDDAIRIEEVEAMREALRELDGDMQIPVVLQYFCGMTSAQIGDLLGISGPAVRTRIREARMILAKRLARLKG